MWLQTLKSRDGKLVVHGHIVGWHSHDEFNFIPQGGSVMNPWWCKLDFWELIEGFVPICRINVLGA